MKEKPQNVDNTRPHWMCQNPHCFPCIVLKGVLNGDLKPCSVWEDSVDDMRDLLTAKHTRILPTETVAAPSGSQPDSVVCSDWLGDGREKARNAFVRLHQDWLGASHREDMNEEMDALATALDLDPFTLRPSPNGAICSAEEAK